MALGINLRAIVGPIISTVHPDVKCTLYRSLGQFRMPDGSAVPTYLEGVDVLCQVQTERSDELAHVERVSDTEISRRFYICSDMSDANRVSGLHRELARSGDFLQVSLSEDWLPGSWWLITAMLEDFTRSGWVNVRGVQQLKGPDFSYSSWAMP